MLLVIDAGNSNVTFGVYDADTLRVHWRIRTEAGRTADEYAALLANLFLQAGLAFAQIGGICIASVVPAVTPDLVRLSRSAFELDPLLVTSGTDMGLHIAYHPPGDVGADRLVDALAAATKYGAPCIVVDFGTGTTLNALIPPTEPGDIATYLGGAICPGIGLSLDALFRRAARLSRVELAKPPAAIGDSTEHALQSGILYGYVAQVDGLVTRFRDELNAPTCPVIATGGYATPLFINESATITALEPLLTLEGLKLVWERCNHSG